VSMTKIIDTTELGLQANSNYFLSL